MGYRHSTPKVDIDLLVKEVQKFIVDKRSEVAAHDIIISCLLSTVKDTLQIETDKDRASLLAILANTIVVLQREARQAFSAVTALTEAIIQAKEDKSTQ